MRMLTEFTRSIAPDVYDFRTVSWLPHFHDMGLALLLFTVWHGGTTTLIPPMAFLRDPGLWPRTIDEARGNLTAAPNFAFDLCVRRVAREDAAGMDLSSMEIMLNGAEPVRAGTLRRFAAHFASAGFRPEAFAPAYGLAEGTVFVSGLRHGGSPRTIAFDRRSLQDGIARAGDGQTLVGCGGRPEGLTVRIVDPTLHTECAAGRIGEIWVHGPSIGLGYQDGDAFDARLAGPDYRPYLRTGDLGFLHDGELFVVGRFADLIILNGRLLQPEDLEYTIERSHRALEGRRCAVFAVGEDENRLAAAVEVRLDQPIDDERRSDIETAIRTAVALEHDVELTEVLIVATGAIPVTTSGKARRAKCRELLLTGALPTL
ncbi:AMP-binding protein [Actinoplanes sp. CA-131856]